MNFCKLHRMTVLSVTLLLAMKQRNYTTSWSATPKAYFRRIPTYPEFTNTYEIGQPLAAGSAVTSSEVLIGSGGVDGRMRPCDHVLDHTEYSAEDIYTSNPYTEFVYRIPGEARKAFMATRSPLSDPIVMSVSDRAALDAEALSFMLPSMSNGFSLINFLIELKDFRKLADAFLKRKGRMRALIFGESASDSTMHAGLGRKTLSDASKAYLNYSFAWKPLVSDVMQIYENLLTVDNRLKEIYKRAGRPQTRHYSRNLEDYPIASEGEWVGNSKWATSSTTDQFSPYRPNWLKYKTRTRYLEKPSYHATCRFNYSVPGIQVDRAKIKGWLDAFGVRPDPSIIWNAIPFSFLVDYIVDVGGYLRRFGQDNLGLQTTIEDYCSSTKSVVIQDYAFFHEHGSDGFGPPAYAGALVHKSYQRRTVIPNLHGAITTTGLSKHEFTIGAALVGANGRKRPTS